VTLHVRLLIALVVGLTLGTALSAVADGTWIEATNTHLLRPIGQLFLRLIFMVVVPLVVSALVIAVFELGRGNNLTGVAGRTLVLTLILSTASVTIGLVLVNLIRPGAGVTASGLAPTPAVSALSANAAATKPVSEVLVDLVPRNPIEAAVRALDGEMLALMVASIIFGIAISRGPGVAAGATPAVVTVLEDVFGASMRIVEWVMRWSPYAVFAIVFGTALTFGTSLLASLGLYVATVVLGLALQQFVVYGAVVRSLAGRRPFEFFRLCRSVYTYAFSTASSNATLPLSIETAETKLGVPRHVARFVLTVGATANQNGTALFEGVTVVFLAQAYGLDLSIADQIRVMVMSIVAGIGTAGVPGGSLPMVLLVAQSVGVPAEGMALVLGVDRFLDMCRSAVNVSGDLVIAAAVGRRG
jgi:dicarboxylate/amino acid:cation (Na+ or H+) symporter, DAACS family